MRRPRVDVGAALAGGLAAPEQNHCRTVCGHHGFVGTTDRPHAKVPLSWCGQDLVPPGIEPVPEWRSDLPPDKRLSAAAASAYGAVARIS